MAYADEQKINLSRVDLKALAAVVCQLHSCSSPMTRMAMVGEANGIECWSTICCCG